MKFKSISVIVSHIQRKKLCVKSEVENSRHSEQNETRIICAFKSCSQQCCCACLLCNEWAAEDITTVVSFLFQHLLFTFLQEPQLLISDHHCLIFIHLHHTLQHTLVQSLNLWCLVFNSQLMLTESLLHSFEMFICQVTSAAAVWIYMLTLL